MSTLVTVPPLPRAHMCLCGSETAHPCSVPLVTCRAALAPVCFQGAGQCLWADEHAMQTLSREADVMILIIDEQASSGSRGSRSGRRRLGDDGRPDGRFVCIGAAGGRQGCVVLHRSRRQHFNAVEIVAGGRGALGVLELPEATRALWPPLKEAAAEAAAGAAGAGGGGGAGAASCSQMGGAAAGGVEAAAVAGRAARPPKRAKRAVRAASAQQIQPTTVDLT